MKHNSRETPYSSRVTAAWNEPPGNVGQALDELASRSQGGLFDVYDGAGGQSIAGTATTVNLDTVRTTSDTTMFVLSGDELTVNLDGGGTIDISYRATLGNTGTDDFGFDVFLEHAPASTGTFAEVTGSRLKGGKGT